MEEIIKLYAKDFLNSDGYLCRTNNRILLSKKHLHDFYEIVLALDGTIQHYYNDDLQTIKKGQYVIIPPGNAHKICDEIGPNPLVLTLAASETEFRSICTFLDISIKDMLTEVKNRTFTMLNQDYQKIEYDFSVYLGLKENMKTARIKSMIAAFLLPVNETTFLRQTVKHSRNELLENALCSMKNDENLRKGINGLLEMTGYSRGHLYKLMKESYEITIHDYIREIRIQKAKNMLLYSDTSYTEIAYELGYSNQSHFIAEFRKITGNTPLEYRKRSKNY